MYIILTQCFPTRIGGIESLVSNLALSIGKNNKIIVFADRQNVFQDIIYDDRHKEKIIVRRYGGIKFFRRRKKVKELKLFIKTGKIQCVIADTWKSIELCIDDLNANNIPVMCLAHGNELISHNNNKKERITSTLNKVSTIVVNSNYTAGLVEKLIEKKPQIKVVHPGATDLRSLDSTDFMNIKGNPVLLTLARLEKRKGHFFILQAMKELKNKFPDIMYIIAGEGSEKANLQRVVNSFDLNNHVFFAGNVNEKQKKQLFKNTTLMVMPTLDESHNRSIEGFGIAYLEAAFFGIPSIASNLGGTPEAVLHEKTGIIIDNHEQLFFTINDLLLNKNKLEDLGKNAQQRAEKKFTWDRVVNNYLSIIKK